MDLRNIFNGGAVERFHIVPGVKTQSVAEHSWGVAVLCQALMPDCSKDLILAAMFHDCAEFVTGDVPAVAKWNHPQLKPILDEIEAEVEAKWGIAIELNPEEKRMLKLCDAFEGMRYCISRRRCGEQGANWPFNKWAKHVKRTFHIGEYELLHFNDLIVEMEMANGA